MASIFGLPCISTNGGNTGIEKCTDTSDYLVYGDILVPDGMTFSLKDLSSIVSTLQIAAKDPDKSKRIFPITGYASMEDRSEERQRSQSGYGNVYAKTRPEIKSERYFIWGNNCLNQSVIKFQGGYSAYNRIMVLSDGSLIATQRKSTTGETVYGGFTLSELEPSSYKQANGSDPAQWYIDYTFANIEEWNNRVLIKPSDGNVLTDLKGLKDISFDFYPQTPVVAGEYVLALSSGCGRVNISQKFATELASIALWKVTAYPSEATLTVSSVASTPDGKTKVTLDTGDADYGTTTKIKFELVDTDALETAGIVGYESGSIVVPK